MTITLYVYTQQHVDEEELASIKKTVDGIVIPRLKTEESASYIYGDGIENMAIVLKKEGSMKNSVMDHLRKECEWIRKHWMRMYNYDISKEDLNLEQN